MRRRMLVPSLAIAVLLILPLAGCGIGKDTGSKVTPKPDKIEIEKDKGKSTSDKAAKSGEAADTVTRTLYLFDENGHVTPQSLNLPNAKTPAEEVLKYLVKDGPASTSLPDGFQAVLPAGTTFKLNLQDDGTLVADFSKQFLNYRAQDEEKMLQAVTWTLTQFDNIKRVKFKVGGKELAEMPEAKTPIPKEGLSRADGINTDLGNVVDITGSRSVVVYYLAENADGEAYYVPVSKRVKSGDDPLTAAVDALINSDPSDPTLASPFDADVELVSRPVVKNGVATLDFNEQLYTDAKKKIVSDEAVNCLALTLTGLTDVKKVAIEVKGNARMTLESGKPLTEPVSRPVVNKTGI